MYSPKVTAEKIKLASKKLGLELTPHSVHEVSQQNKRLNELLGDDGRLTRALSTPEMEWCLNERFLSKLDFRYYITRYFFIRNWSGRLERLNPNVAQNIVIDIWGSLEEQNRAISIQELKARQLGVSTVTEASVAHRVQFYRQVNAVVASSDPAKSAKMAEMMERGWQNMPWWLLPVQTTYNAGELIEFGEMNSGVSIQHGSQFTGIARGDTPTVAHLSELADFLSPEELVDASLLRAMHESPRMFLVLESTAKGRKNWWHRTWEYSKQYWASGMAKLYPMFLPWFVGRDIYPTETWLRSHPIPAEWQPAELTVHHAERAAAYTRSDDILRRFLGENWTMPPEQMWWWEVNRQEYAAKKELPQFYCVSGDTRVSTNQGIIPIRDAQSSSFVETGGVSAWLPKGKKKVVRLTTKLGREIVCTPDHRLLTEKGWISAENLSRGDVIILSKPCFVSELYKAEWQWSPTCKMTIPIDSHWARLLGYFVGDGSWGSDSIEISCCAKDADTVADVCHVIERVVGAKPREQTDKRSPGLIRIRSSSVRWWEMLWNLGTLDRRLHKKQNRNSGYIKRCRVPECIWRSPRHIIREFLRGLFESDGHSFKHALQITLSAKSALLLREVQLLLLGFGINSSISETPKVNGEGRIFECHVLRLNALAARIFHDEIGFVSQRKNDTGSRHIYGRKGRCGRNPLPNEMKDSVLSVSSHGECDVYDLTVPETHCFGANGIMAHNSETPADDMEAFQSTNVSAFDTDTLTSYRELTREPVAVFGFVGRGDQIPVRMQPDRREIDHELPPINIRARWNPSVEPFECQMVPLKFRGYPNTDPNGKYFMWEMPEDDEYYGVGVDTGDGVGLDRSCLEVLRKGTLERNDAQVGEFVNPYINAFDLWSICMAVGSLYSTNVDGHRRQAKMVIDCLKNGESTQWELRKRGWTNFHLWVRFDNKRVQASKANKIGWFANSWARAMMMDYALKALRDQFVDINSPYFVDEMADLERDEFKQSLKAVFGGHDDRFVAFGQCFISLHIMEIRSNTIPTLSRRQALREANQIDPVYQPGWQANDQLRDWANLEELERQALILDTEEGYS
jgi:intein/homing endonuclease